MIEASLYQALKGTMAAQVALETGCPPEQAVAAVELRVLTKSHVEPTPLNACEIVLGAVDQVRSEQADVSPFDDVEVT